MEPTPLLASIPAVAGLSFAALIVFIIAAVQESKHGAPTADIVKRGYLYLVAFVTLLIASAALVTLLDTGLRAAVFTKAVDIPAYRSAPPGLYLPTEAPDATKTTPATLRCTEGCTLTASEKDAVASWAQSYREWQRTTDPAYQRSQSLVTSISFLLIALLVYLFHWVLARREHAQHASTGMRITYLWSVSFIMLMTTVLAAAFLLNTTLKAAFLKDSRSTTFSEPFPTADRAAVESVVTCGNACGLDAETAALAQEWLTDRDAALQKDQSNVATQERHGSFAREIAFLLVALPLFFVHFRTVWRETRTAKDSGSTVKLV